MEDTHPDIPPVTRTSDKRIVRQASYSFAFVALLAVVSFGAYVYGTSSNTARVLGTETVVTPTPYPTLPPIPTLIPTTPALTPAPTKNPTPTPTPKVQVTLKPPFKSLRVIPSPTPTPVPAKLKLSPDIQKIQIATP